MMIDFALELERKGNYTASESAYQGSLIRFRPIMMTSACTIMGTVPIAIGIGANAGALRSLGLCVRGWAALWPDSNASYHPVFYTYMGAFADSGFIPTSAQRLRIRRRGGAFNGRRAPGPGLSCAAYG